MRRAIIQFAWGLILAISCSSCSAQKPEATTPGEDAAAAANAEAQLAWPRTIREGPKTLIIYQPQLDSWSGDEIQGTAAVSVATTGTDDMKYGVIWFTARTDVDKTERIVTLDEVQVLRDSFPADKANEAPNLELIRRHIITAAREIPLDHLEAALTASQSQNRAAAVPVKNEVPLIIYSTKPALLVLIDGEPALRQVSDTPLLRVVNTRALILFDPTASEYYLHAVDHWMMAKSVRGPWLVAPTVPTSVEPILRSLSADKTIDPLDPDDPGTAPKELPTIYVRIHPAELIQTQGEPEYVSIEGTRLLYVKNTDNALFMMTGPPQFFLLVSGRWFQSGALTGPWAFTPGNELPADFSNIPSDSPKANVLLSVPGTAEAQEAVIANSIPQTAAVKISEAHLTVSYDGAPKFAPIDGTMGLSYATNAALPVVFVNGPDTYWCVQNGIWFTAAKPVGPWVVATTVPSIIYAIPASSPIHYVTYVYVYKSTPDVVYVGYTPGYMGTCVTAEGVVVYGTGYYYPAYVGTTWVGYPPTYGYGASFACGAATGLAFGFVAGAIIGDCWSHPYWGPCGWGGGWGYSHVNINTAGVYHNWGGGVTSVNRHYAYNGWTGASARSGSERSFNPYTGRQSAAGYQGYRDPSTGNFGARGGAATYNPNTGIIRGGGGSISGNADDGTLHAQGERGYYNTQTGNGAAVYDNNVYAGHDGNVYRHTDSGWEQHTSGGGWQGVQSNGNGDQLHNLNSQQKARNLGSERFSNFNVGRFAGRRR